MAVPQIVEANMGDFGTFDNRPEVPLDNVVSVERLPVPLAEDQAVVLVLVTQGTLTEASALQRVWAVHALIEDQGESHTVAGRLTAGNEEHHAPYEIRQRHSKTSVREIAARIHR